MARDSRKQPETGGFVAALVDGFRSAATVALTDNAPHANALSNNGTSGMMIRGVVVVDIALPQGH